MVSKERGDFVVNSQQDVPEVLVAKNVNTAFDSFLNEEVILDRECAVCLSKHNASLEKRVVVAGKYLII